MGNLADSRKYFFFLIVFCGILFFSTIGFRQLLRPDEPRVAGVAAEMARTHDYLMPRLNGEPFLEQPPLYSWVSSYIFDTLGKSPFTARLFPAAAAFFGALLVYLFARRTGLDGLASFLAGAATATSAEYWAIGNRVLTDMPLCFFIIVAMLSFYNLHLMYKEHGSNKMFIFWYPVFVFGLAGALLTKSLIGVAIPTCALFFWLLLECYYDRRLYSESWYALATGALISLIPLAAWVTGLYIVHGYESAYTVVWYNNFGRFAGDHPDHAEPFYYYTEYVFTHLMPWTVLMITAIWYCVRQKGILRNDHVLRFLLSWLVFPFIMLCFASGKRPVYLLPLLPAGAFFASVYSLKLFDSLKKFKGYGRNRIVSLLLILVLIGYFAASIVITVSGNNKNSYDGLFSYCRKTVGMNDGLYLYKSSEAVRGAVEFYLGRTAGIVENPSEIDSMLDNRRNYIISQEGDAIKPEWIQKKFKVRGDNLCVLHKK